MDSRYKRAITRNIHEIGQARYENAARKAILKAEPCIEGYSFWIICANALFNSMLGHTIKVLDWNSDSATFWYLYRCNKKQIVAFLSEKTIEDINSLTDKLKVVRNSTLFHMGKKAVFNPEEVWREAAIKHSEFDQAIEDLWRLLNHLYKLEFNEDLGALEYTGEDVAKIIKKQ